MKMLSETNFFCLGDLFMVHINWLWDMCIKSAIPFIDVYRRF